MNLSFKTIERPLRIIVPLAEVKRRAIIDALDKCNGSYRLAARLLGIGKLHSIGWPKRTTTNRHTPIGKS
jgi:hypothetical protein